MLVLLVGKDDWEGLPMQSDAVCRYSLTIPHVHGAESTFFQVYFHARPFQLVHRFRDQDRHRRHSVRAIRMPISVDCEAPRASGIDVALQCAASQRFSNDSMHWIEECAENPRTWLGTLCNPPPEHACCASSKPVSHDWKGAIVHSLEQHNILWLETFYFEDTKDHSVVYRIEGILDVEVKDD